MKNRWKPAWAILGLTAGLTGLVGTSPAKAQAWADNNYAYRRTLTLVNNSAVSIATNDIVGYSYVPAAGALAGKTRSDGKDVKVFYNNGGGNVTVPQALLSMGSGAAKILFPAQAAIPAPPPYTITETIAGNTSYASLPKGPALTFASLDDSTLTVTLPFPVTLRDRTSNQITISIDGYFGLGATDPGRPNATETGAAKYIVMPFQTDLAINGTGGQGVFYTADATQAVIKWEVQASTGTADAIIAKFACVVKADGTIRFVYGNPCQMPAIYSAIAEPGIGYDPVRYGLGVADPASKITEPTWDAFEGVDFDTPPHADIAYTQLIGSTQATGYWLYYGNTLDDGITGRTAPDPTKLVAYTFDDDTLQGWTTVSANPDTEALDAITYQGAKVLHLNPGPPGDHPQVWAAGQTLLLGDAVVYSRIAGGEMAIGARCNDAMAGYYHLQPGYGNQKQIIQRGTTGDYAIISNTKPFTVSGWTTNILKVTGTGASISISGKGWNDGGADPGVWEVTSSPITNAANQYDTGTLGLNGYSADLYLDWVYATGPTAEITVATLGATDEQNPNIGILKGTVTERFSHKSQAAMKIVLTDNTTGVYVAETATNALGQYNLSLASGVTYGLAAIGNGYGVRTTASVPGGTSVTKDLVVDVIANGDCEVPTSDNSQPDQWEHYWFGAAPAFYGLSNEQNHTPGGHWSMKVSGATADSASVQTGIGRTGNNLFQHPIITGCSYTLSTWVYFTQAGGKIRFRLRNGWPSVSPVITAGAAPDPLNENTGGLDVNGKVPVGQWYQVKRTWPFVVGGAANPLPIEYGIYIQGATGVGDVYVDDVTLTPNTSALNMVIANVVNDLGAPIPSPYLGEMRYGGKMFAGAAPGLPDGKGFFYTATSTPITLAAWQGPLSRVPTNIDPIGALVGVTNATPVPYDPNLTAPTATVIVTRKASNILSTGNGTVGLLNGDSQWSAYLIDKRIDKTGVTDPGDSTNPANWVQVRRNSTGDAGTVDGQAKLARIWNASVDGEGNGWGAGGMRGVLSKDGSTDVPERYRTTTFDIDMGSTWPIDQLEFSYFFAINKHRVWISDTPFSWNVELPNSSAVLDTTTDATSVASQGFPSSNMPYDQQPAGPYQIYRFLTPVSGRYLRVRQDGAPFGDGHQILMEMRAMSKAAFPAPITGRVLNELGQPVAGAFVGPFPKGSAGDYSKTAADGTFTWVGPGVPTQLGVHVEAKLPDNTYAAIPYLMAGPFTVVPAVGASMGDIIVYPSTGNAMAGATSIFVTNEGAVGTEAYAPGLCDPSYATHPLSKLTDQLAGDANQWIAKPSDSGGNPCPGDVTTGASYLRMGVETTLAAPADLSEIDIYWFQNGFPPGFYVQVTKDNGTTWTTVYTTTSYAGNYNDGFPGDGLKVAPIKFATITGVQKTRVIFSTKSNREDNGNVFIINEIVALKANTAIPVAADITNALRIAAGLVAGPATASAEFVKLNVVNTGASAGKIDIADAIALAKTTPH